MDNSFDLTIKAFNLATESHNGQMYGKEPYIYHCLRVAMRVLDLSRDTIAFRCALLHDIVEDTNITISDINRLFGEETAEVVDYLTRRTNETYAKYINRLIQNPLARLIKLADLEENIQHSYLANDPERFKSLISRWEAARDKINNYESHSDK